MTVSPAKVAELIVMQFGMLTWVGPRNHVLDGVQITREEAILRAKKGRHRTCPDILEATQQTAAPV